MDRIREKGQLMTLRVATGRGHRQIDDRPRPHRQPHPEQVATAAARLLPGHRVAPPLHPRRTPHGLLRCVLCPSWRWQRNCRTIKVV